MREVETEEIAPGWQIALPPPEEQARLEELRRYRILDSWPSPHFDNITELVARLLGVEIALVSLVDEKRQWFKSSHGTQVEETGRDESFCSHVIWNNEVMVIHDTGEDARFCGNPLVLHPPKIRFYAGAPLISSNGYRLGTLCVIDSKPREEFGEREIYTLQRLSEVVVDEMELHLSNIQLGQLSQTKTNFLATMSHEIRTPMNGIIGMASMLQHTELDDRQRRFVDIISKSADALLEIINDILDLSKIEAGKMELESRPVNLVQVGCDALDVVSLSAQEKGLELMLEVDPDMACVALGDPVRIRQIMLNLLSNAVKFTDMGEIALRIEATALPAGGLRGFVISVRDTGIGIAEDKLPVIFNKFDQADMSTTRKFGGTGLGLAICANLCEMMGGSIRAQSVVGEGSTFIAEIALAVDRERAGERHVFTEAPESYRIVRLAESGDGPASASAEPPRSAAVLLVEDNPVNREVMLEMLADAPCELLTASNGREALEMLGKKRFDLVLMDCSMPEMDGYETTRRIRQHSGENVRKVPVVALTACAMQGDREKCLEAGMDDYMTKPLMQDALLAMLDKWLNRQEAA